MSKLFMLFLIVCVALAACKSRKKKTERQPGYCLHKHQSIREGEYLPAALGKCKAMKCTNAAENIVKPFTCTSKDMGRKCVKLSKGINRNVMFPECCPKMQCDN